MQHLNVVASFSYFPTLCLSFRVFITSILNSLLIDHTIVALLLYPTKALAQDQLRSFKNLLNKLSPSTRCIKCQTVNMECLLATVMTLDGDTSQEQRLIVTNSSNVILANPDILHYTILPNHRRFDRILSNLRYIVLGKQIHETDCIVEFLDFSICLYPNCPNAVGHSNLSALHVNLRFKASLCR